MTVCTSYGSLIWSLASSGIGTTVTASGNSGGWSAANPNAESALDLRFVDDVTVYVNAGTGAGSSPAMSVQLDVFDDLGGLYPQVAKLAAAFGSAGGTAWFSAGRHNATSQIVLPAWGRISWIVTGATPSFTGVEIAVYGR